MNNDTPEKTGIGIASFVISLVMFGGWIILMIAAAIGLSFNSLEIIGVILLVVFGLTIQ